MTRVSVIVPVRNESRSIRTTVQSLLQQDYPADQFEVIVSDGFSTDHTVAIVRELQADHPNLKLVYNANRWSSAGRNVALRQMTGDVAVVIDGHCHVPDRNYLRHLVAAFEASGAECLGRPQPLTAPNPTTFQSSVCIARSSRLGHNPDSDIYSDQAKFVPPQSTAVAYRKSVFQTIGLFDQRFDACEDVEFNQRVHEAGFRCYFTPDITIIYDPRTTPRGLFMQMSRYGAGRARLAAKNPKSLTLPALVPPAWFLFVIIGALLCLFVPALWIGYFATVALYSSVIAGASLMLGRGQPLGIRVRLPIIFVIIHFAFAWGFLREVWQTLRQTIASRLWNLSKPSRTSPSFVPISLR